MFPFVSKQVVILLEQCVRVCNHVAEAAQIIFGEHPFNSGEDVGNFTATPEHFLIGKRSRIFGFTHSRDWQFVAPQASDIFSVLLRTDQLVLATTHEIQQVIEKLTHLRGPHEIIQM